MRVPLTWLREYCDPDLDVNGIEERLTMTGTKVEAIHHHGVSEPERFVVGRVLACERHPDADRLSVCEVDLGPAAPDRPATIVCGAPNVAAGQTVAVATPGAVMPDGMKIKRAKLRGVASEGMILAEQELAIGGGDRTEGILVLDDDELAPGAPLASVLPIATAVLELEITPNRPDCLGVYGVARELHAATGAALAPQPWDEDPGSEGALPSSAGGGPLAEVEVRCPDLCPRFTARVFEHVTVAQSPPWLKARLSAAGQRPINNVVDITNYVMLLCSQPLHAFDLDRVAGGRLVVRRARDGEQVQTLDGQTRTLDGEMVMIEDADGPTSIAGLMGGARSEVGVQTTRVLMEVANWNGPNIHRSSWALGLRSEASARFEKGLPPEQCMYAQALATRLMIELCGATVVPGTIDVGDRSEIGQQASARAIHLREARVRAILGVPVARERQEEILQALDFETSQAPDGLDVGVPPLRRADVTREADLIEEVARIDGLEKLPATLPPRRPAGLLSHEQRLRRRAVDALVGRGLYEVVGWTFTSPATLARLRLPGEDPRSTSVALENPLSEDQSLLRTTLFGSLLDIAAHNATRGTSDMQLFEVGTVFRVADATIVEHSALAILLAGRLTPADWRAPESPTADLFAAKAMLEALAEALRVPDLSFTPEAQPFLHPGRSATMLLGETQAGWLGELHPLVAESWGLAGVACLEIDFDLLIAHALRPKYVDLVDYPVVLRDLAVGVAEEIPSGEVVRAIRDVAGELLVDVQVFDVYIGSQAGPGNKSIAMHLKFQAPDRTLTDDEVKLLIDRILRHLHETFGAAYRA
jgi:phenylalanyl-tRNA synthetase beta chain